MLIERDGDALPLAPFLAGAADPGRLPPAPPEIPPAEGIPLLLVRHGETYWTRAGRIQGRSDPDLHPEGVAQLRALGRKLRGLAHGLGAKRACIVSSPLRRASESARHLAAGLGPPRMRRLAPDARLAELDFGAWEGLTQPQVKARWPDLLRSWKRQPDTVRLPGGETLAEARARWRAFLADPPWDQKAPPDLVVAVTHAAIIRIALLEGSGRALEGFRAVMVPLASAHHFRVAAGQALAVTDGDPA